MKFLAWRAAAVVAAVYGFFLIFAQFSFVELLRAGGASLVEERVALGGMAVAGMAGGFWAAWRGVSAGKVRWALGVAAGCAVLAPFFKEFPGALGVAVATGGALGVATVSLAASLPGWCGVGWIGLGTGLGYAVCNVPWVFLQTPSGQAWCGAGMAVLGGLAVPSGDEWRMVERQRVFPWWGVLAGFTALVWLDSAAFFIIQHTAALKGGTWDSGGLWRNALVHLAVAVAAGQWLLRGGRRFLPMAAWLVLAVAAVAVNEAPHRWLAGWLYPAGVSLYSTALVAWPGWFSGADGKRAAAWRAAWLFAVAGWCGSANGIGMAQTLNRVPLEFIGVAGLVMAGVLLAGNLKHWRVAAAVGVVGAVWVVGMAGTRRGEKFSETALERGRQVYVAEGCIHCHSQYVRPDSPDVEAWGPVREVSEVLKGEPVLIGNRRQGPDLTQVGARRSEAWLKLHFINPRALVPGSGMPSYAHLFESERGDDLIRYLKDFGVGGTVKVMEISSKWRPEQVAADEGGAELFARHCAACHGAEGRGDGPLSEKLWRRPANLVEGPFVWTPAGPDLEMRVARVVKFGLPGTDMPGHEVLKNGQIFALRDVVLKLRAP